MKVPPIYFKAVTIKLNPSTLKYLETTILKILLKDPACSELINAPTTFAASKTTTKTPDKSPRLYPYHITQISQFSHPRCEFPQRISNFSAASRCTALPLKFRGTRAWTYFALYTLLTKFSRPRARAAIADPISRAAWISSRVILKLDERASLARDYARVHPRAARAPLSTVFLSREWRAAWVGMVVVVFWWRMSVVEGWWNMKDLCGMSDALFKMLKGKFVAWFTW